MFASEKMLGSCSATSSLATGAGAKQLLGATALGVPLAGCSFVCVLGCCLSFKIASQPPSAQLAPRIIILPESQAVPVPTAQLAHNPGIIILPGSQAVPIANQVMVRN